MTPWRFFPELPELLREGSTGLKETTIIESGFAARVVMACPEESGSFTEARIVRRRAGRPQAVDGKGSGGEIRLLHRGRFMGRRLRRGGPVSRSRTLQREQAGRCDRGLSPSRASRAFKMPAECQHGYFLSEQIIRKNLS